MFDDLMAANAVYRAAFRNAGLEGRAAKRLAVVTCIDSRIDPLAMLGLEPGDAKIIRNAGARVTDDALRSLILAVNLLDVDRVCVVQHTDCAMVGKTDDQVRAQIEEHLGVSAREWEFFTTMDQTRTLRADLQRIVSCALIPASVAIGGFVFDVATGGLTPAASARDGSAAVTSP